ncbi:unnamed protein product [Phaedon cochleariae]|uniref:Uncharacterized protein n=1 Tax=Phaedon cochleariae TaxID=80249 RepID=A0A9P0DLX0_PHACE|nr:unnamed protein product [Phaedon cochleariae]
MEQQNQEMVVTGSPAEVPNDPGKMFIGGLSWQTSPGKIGVVTVFWTVRGVNSVVIRPELY